MELINCFPNSPTEMLGNNLKVLGGIKDGDEESHCHSGTCGQPFHQKTSYYDEQTTFLNKCCF